jgi:hypothetical protein
MGRFPQPQMYSMVTATKTEQCSQTAGRYTASEVEESPQMSPTDFLQRGRLILQRKGDRLPHKWNWENSTCIGKNIACS